MYVNLCTPCTRLSNGQTLKAAFELQIVLQKLLGEKFFSFPRASLLYFVFHIHRIISSPP